MYYPKQENINNVFRICEQSDLVIICDNSPDDNNLFWGNNHKIEYYNFKNNLGLSAAFNSVLISKKDVLHDDDICIFFDQDSIITENHIKKLINEFLKLEYTSVKVGCIGPYYSDINDSFVMKKKKECSTCVVEKIITSSMLIRYRTLKNISFWNEELFLDMADWDLCWRLNNDGYKCYITSSTVMEHEIGKGKRRIGPFWLKIGQPIREYYQSRDCIKLLWKKYVPFYFKFRIILMFTIRPILHIIFLDNSRRRLYYVIKGIKDGIMNVKGSLQEKNHA